MTPRRLFLSFAALAALFAAAPCSAKHPAGKPLRLLYWNIQNGMWSGQDDGYDRFVRWVGEIDPDICVWCEAQSNYVSGTADKMPEADRYLVAGWGELAARYGHKYWYVGGHRDNFPQVITSKYPIENVARIVGEEPDSVVTHGAGWARIRCKGRTINVVTLHLWPQVHAYRAPDVAASRAAREGDRYRRMEIEYICRHTIASDPDGEGLWMMMGDFNAQSRLDNGVYGYAEDDSRLLTQDYVLECTPYADVIAHCSPDRFQSTTAGRSRIDFVYCTPPLRNCVTHAEVVRDTYTEPVRDAKRLSNFWHPSDHRPIVVEFDLKKTKKR